VTGKTNDQEFLEAECKKLNLIPAMSWHNKSDSVYNELGYGSKREALRAVVLAARSRELKAEGNDQAEESHPRSLLWNWWGPSAAETEDYTRALLKLSVDKEFFVKLGVSFSTPSYPALALDHVFYKEVCGPVEDGCKGYSQKSQGKKYSFAVLNKEKAQDVYVDKKYNEKNFFF
jgi:hypothetical protein